MRRIVIIRFGKKSSSYNIHAKFRSEEIKRELTFFFNVEVEELDYEVSYAMWGITRR